MRLLSTTLKNYRIHRDLTVEFDPERTLIGGPNESGKSTLVEAVHRALFLRAKGTGGPHQAMKSFLGGHPEVELRFEAAGRRYHLAKRFSGQSGATSLTSPGLPALNGDAAETELARLLGVDCEANAKAACEHWAHLWAWQGQSAADPSDHANRQRDPLLQRLGQAGGAANLMQSERDSRVAAAFAEVAAGIFKQGDKARADSALARAEAEAATAAAQHASASAQLQKLRHALDEFTQSAAALAGLHADLAKLNAEAEATEKKAVRLGALQQLQARQAADLTAASAVAKGLQQADDDIRALREKTARDEADLAPLATEAERLARSLEKTRADAAAALLAYDTASDRVRAFRQLQELAAAESALFAALARRDEGKQRAEQARSLARSVRALEDELSKLPALDVAQVKRIQTLESERLAAEAALQAMAAGVDVVSADQPVRLGNRELRPGESDLVTEQTELTIGTGTRLRLRPGGGTRLADARRALQDAQTQLAKQFDALGVPSVDAAVELSRRRSELAAQVKSEKVRLEDLGLADAEKKLRAAEDECLGLEADVVRRRSSLSAAPKPVLDAAQAQQSLASAAAALREAETQETSARALRDKTSKALAEAETAHGRHRATFEAQNRALADRRAQLRLLLERNGEDTPRREALGKARTIEALAQKTLSETETSIAAEQPELLGATQVRLKRALEDAHRRRQEAEQKRAVAEHTLRADGTLNPEEDLSLAQARLEGAEERLASVRRHAKAVQLLDTLFRSEKQSLAAQFTQPLVDRVSAYLQALYGPGARAQIEYDGNAFSPLKLSRPQVEGGSAIAFDKLSGGTREQVACAMRLAMAEVLAANHDGNLPLVLDDAFANADPDRVQVLQRMLDFAATRGLQIVVVTCTPSDYVGLGAKTIALSAA
ncbi:hypothetical protein DB347_19770 [Opitutaceae bacterium EW11]|nr:hypothetical protein DB347_19770 [Opitutaceae bacterium EW11]